MSTEPAKSPCAASATGEAARSTPRGTANRRTATARAAGRTIAAPPTSALKSLRFICRLRLRASPDSADYHIATMLRAGLGRAHRVLEAAVLVMGYDLRHAGLTKATAARVASAVPCQNVFMSAHTRRCHDVSPKHPLATRGAIAARRHHRERRSHHVERAGGRGAIR